jgi:hypothetical protein
MDQGAYSRTPSRAEQLWSHLSGLFGGEALKRKFGMTPPQEWASALSYLTDAQLGHGVEKLMRSGAEHIPSLPQFIAMCKDAREFEADSSLKLSGPQFDNWAVAGNNHFLAYVLRAMRRKRHLSEDQTREFVKFKNAWAEDMRADDRGSGVPIEAQKAAWLDCMKRAEQATGFAP